MSFQINWDLLQDGVEARRLQLLLNDFLRQVDRPDFLGELVITSLDFGTIPPHVEILDIGDPLDEFYLPDDVLLPPVPLGAEPAPTLERTTSSRTVLTTGAGASVGSAGGVPSAQPLDPGRSGERGALLSASGSLPSLAHGVEGTSSMRGYPGATAIATFPNGGAGGSFPYTQEQIASMKRETDVQVDALLEYNGNLTLGITTELIINQPTPGFMAMPLTVTLRGFRFRGKAIIAYLGDRVNFCFEEPEGLLDGSGGGARTSVLEDVHIESEIGDANRQVLKNIEKIEKFVVDTIRRGIDEYLVFPAYHSLDLIRPYDAAE